MLQKPSLRAVRGRLLWFVDDPAIAGARAYRYLDDGIMIIRNGMITAIGEHFAMERQMAPGIEMIDTGRHLVMPGFIDAHLHFPQTQVIASYAQGLIDWLNRFTFIEEQRFANPSHARKVAAFFVDALLRNGTTTAAVFGSVHPASAEAFFEAADQRNARMVAGKVMMDRNAPAPLLDTARQAYDETQELIGRWHGHGRQQVAIAPRFAITSTPEQLEAAGALMREHPDCLMMTHLSESRQEIETVASLFPEARDYTDVYDHFGLVGRNSLFGHCIHLGERERLRLAGAGAVAVHCPTSNLFLGSGLFDWQRARDSGMTVAIASDIGAGTSYSMLRTLGEAFKVQRLLGHTLDPFAAFHAVTLGNATALRLDQRIGSFAPGREADFVVLDAGATPEMAHRLERVTSLADELFLLMTMGDERAVRDTYVMGERFLALA
ncbi:MAG TPA: guanine deaminase [Beijerinckiaceae bacterium]|mgnify:CR=1 FL=1|nr:guanine deaminase [Beijerinckiaceae bacterium]